MDEVEEEEELRYEPNQDASVRNFSLALSTTDARTYAEAEAGTSESHRSVLWLLESGEVEKLVPLLRRESSFDGADREREESEVDESDDPNRPSKADFTREEVHEKRPYD